MENAVNLWSEVKTKLRDSYDKEVFADTFDVIQGVHKISNGYIYLVVSNAVVKYRIEKIYLSKMDDIASKLTNETVKFKIITQADAEKENSENEKPLFSSADSVKSFKSRTLRPEYTFDNFVTGEANREAFYFALKVAESPHVTVNPLYIFGDVGFGKTHLMTAIGHYILDNNINANVVYTTAQQYVDDYFNATNKNNKNPNALEQFNTFYRSADLLLVDDIQFLKDKVKSQEEFFKLFEYLHENNKQIVITSDRPSSELEIMARLKSRFSWGIPVDVKKPNFDLRKLILKKKLTFLITDPNSISDDALDYISQNFDENVRELEGALRRFVSYCVAFNIDFTLENAETALSSIVSKDKKIGSTPDSASYVEIVKSVISSYFNINVKELSSSSRKQEFVYARMVAAYLLRTVFNLTLKKIGEFLGGRDHATIAHGIEKVSQMLVSDLLVKQDIESITDKIQAKKTKWLKSYPLIHIVNNNYITN